LGDEEYLMYNVNIKSYNDYSNEELIFDFDIQKNKEKIYITNGNCGFENIIFNISEKFSKNNTFESVLSIDSWSLLLNNYIF